MVKMHSFSHGSLPQCADILLRDFCGIPRGHLPSFLSFCLCQRSASLTHWMTVCSPFYVSWGNMARLLLFPSSMSGKTQKPPRPELSSQEAFEP